MRSLLIAAALAVGPATAQSPFLTGDELAAEVARNCDAGCLILSPTEVETMNDALNFMVMQRMQMAYEAGKKEAQDLCRNRI